MSNPYEVQSNWLMIQTKDKEKLVEYMKAHTELDESSGRVKIESF